MEILGGLVGALAWAVTILCATDAKWSIRQKRCLGAFERFASTMSFAGQQGHREGPRTRPDRDLVSHNFRTDPIGPV
jgi:hypothetical protein